MAGHTPWSEIKQLEWGSEIARARETDIAARVARELDDPPMGNAYLYAAWISENEISDGRAGSPLQEAAAALCDAILDELPSRE